MQAIKQRRKKYELTISPTTQFYDAFGGSFNVAVTSNATWSIQPLPSWITVNINTGTGNGNVIVSVGGNGSTSGREGNVIFEVTGITRSCTITQSGNTGGL